MWSHLAQICELALFRTYGEGQTSDSSCDGFGCVASTSIIRSVVSDNVAKHLPRCPVRDEWRLSIVVDTLVPEIRTIGMGRADFVDARIK